MEKAKFQTEKNNYLRIFVDINVDESKKITKDELYCYGNFFMSPKEIEEKIKKPKDYLEQFKLFLYEENFTKWLANPIENELNIKSLNDVFKEGKGKGKYTKTALNEFNPNSNKLKKSFNAAKDSYKKLKENINQTTILIKEYKTKNSQYTEKSKGEYIWNDKLFDEFDTDNSGDISESEFLKFMYVTTRLNLKSVGDIDKNRYMTQFDKLNEPKKQTKQQQQHPTPASRQQRQPPASPAQRRPASRPASRAPRRPAQRQPTPVRPPAQRRPTPVRPPAQRRPASRPASRQPPAQRQPSVLNIRLKEVKPVVGEPTPRTVQNQPYKERMDELRNQYNNKLSEFKNFKNNKNNFKENLKQQLTILCSSNSNINLSTIPALNKADTNMLFSIYQIISINEIFMNQYLKEFVKVDQIEEIEISIQDLCSNIKELIKNKNSNDFGKQFKDFCDKLEKLLDLLKKLISGVKIDLNKKLLNELYFDISSLLSKYQKDARLTSREQGKKNDDWNILNLPKKYKILETNYKNLKNDIGQIINNLDNIENEKIDYLFEEFIKIYSLLDPKERGKTGNMKIRFIIDLLKKLKEIIDDRLKGNIVMPVYDYLDEDKIKNYLENKIIHKRNES